MSSSGVWNMEPSRDTDNDASTQVNMGDNVQGTFCWGGSHHELSVATAFQTILGIFNSIISITERAPF